MYHERPTAIAVPLNNNSMVHYIIYMLYASYTAHLVVDRPIYIYIYIYIYN